MVGNSSSRKRSKSATESTSSLRRPAQFLQRGEDSIRLQSGEAAFVGEDFQVWISWCPDFSNGLPPQRHSGNSQCCREVRDAGIVPDKGGARHEPPTEFGERKVASHLDAVRWQTRCQTLQSIALRFPADKQQSCVTGHDKAFQEFSPFLFRPILPLAAAPRMQSQA